MGLLVLSIALGVLLLLSLGANLALWIVRNQMAEAWRARAIQAEDRAHAAELRSGRQIDAMLDRIRKDDRLQVVAPTTPTPDPDVKLYSSDTEGDYDWNEFQGEPEGAEVQEGQSTT